MDKFGKDMKILVYDFGGGTLDVTIMEFGKGVFEVKSTNGDTQLGGTDMDNAIVNFLAGEIKSKNGMDISQDKQAMQRLREAAEKAKIELSTVLSSEINLPFLGTGSGRQAGALHLHPHQGEARGHSGPDSGEDDQAGDTGAQGREAGAQGHRQGDTDRRSDAGCR